MEKVFCSKCNKCLTDDNGASMTFLSLDFSFKEKYNNSLVIPGLVIPNNKELLLHSLGKYENKPYNFCHECVLDGLMKGE